AEVAGQAALDLLLAVELARLEQRGDREQHPRRAEAALQSSVAREGLLEPLELGPLREPLDRQDVRAGGVRREEAAGADGLPVDEHGAGTAHLHVAGAL